MRINQHIGSVDIKIDTKRIEGNFRKAQAALNIAVRDDCEPLVPHLNGGLRGSFRFGNGDVHSDFVEWIAPYSHYMYEGELYLAANGSSWAKKHEKKFPADKPLHYHPKNSGTTDHWFEKAKDKNLDKWVQIVKEEIGKE